MNAEAEALQAGVSGLMRHVRTFSSTDKGRALHEFFEENTEAEGIVVMDGPAPAGIIMRTEFYQKMGQQFGYDLFYNRPLEILMKKDLLIIESNIELSELGMLSMNRAAKNLYDFILIRTGDKFIGVVSIRDLLVELSKAKEREIELLKKQQELLREANEKERQYRQHVEQMNGVLNQRSQSIKNLLDNAEQGFLQFSADRVISEEYSQVCNHIFDRGIGGQDYLAVIAPHVGGETQETMRRALDGAFQAGTQTLRDVYLSLLPDEASIRNRNIRFQYKPFTAADGNKILVIMTDITAKKKLDAKLLEEKCNIKLIMRALSHRSEVKQAVSAFLEFSDCMRKAVPPSSSLHRLYRQIHTFKGDFAQIGMLHASEELHRVETGLSECIASGGERPVTDVLDPLTHGDILESDIRVITDALGRGFFEEKESITVPADRLESVEQSVLAAVPEEIRADVARRFGRIRNLSLRQEIGKYDEYINYIAQGMGKGVQPINFSGENVYIDGSRYGGFIRSLVHIFRNSIDHGIEEPCERELQGKPPAGSIACSAARDGNRMILTISDDGRGLDCGRIREKAVDLGLLPRQQADALTEAEIHSLILMDGFSTKEDVSALSGRGMGMAAVLQTIKELDGTLEIRSASGEGTAFVFALPFEWE